jgi:hypothetical protein
MVGWLGSLRGVSESACLRLPAATRIAAINNNVNNGNIRSTELIQPETNRKHIGWSKRPSIRVRDRVKTPRPRNPVLQRPAGVAAALHACRFRSAHSAFGLNDLRGLYLTLNYGASSQDTDR